MNNIQYQIAREVKNIIEEMQQLRKENIEQYLILRDELKRDVGNEFYNKWFQEALQI